MSVTDGNITPADPPAEMSVRVVGTVSTTSGGGPAATVNQGTPAAVASAWPIKLVDAAGVNVAAVNGTGQIGAAQGLSGVNSNGWFMRITDGTRNALVDANGAQIVAQATPGTVANAWPIKNTDGTNTANVAVPGPNLGAGLIVSTGVLISSTTLTAASAIGNGTTVDFGSAKANISLAITAGTGVTAGQVAVAVSQDSTNWFQAAVTPATGTGSVTQPGVYALTVSGGAWRYARGVIASNITGGTVSATLMAS